MRILPIILSALLPLYAGAQEECYEAEPVVSLEEVWDFSSGGQREFYLPTRTIFGGYLTWAAAHFQWGERIQLRIDHIPPKEQPLGLPYSIYRLQILVGEPGREGSLVYDKDFTQGCTNPGPSVSPGQSIDLLPIKLLPLPDGAQRGREKVQIRIWGRHN